MSGGECKNVLGEAAADESLDARLARHRQYLTGVARRLLNTRLRTRLDASDIAQEALLDAVRSSHDIGAMDDSNLHRLLTSIVRRRCIDAQRRHISAARRTVRREIPFASPLGFGAEVSLGNDSSAPDQKAGRTERLRQVQRALAQLSTGDRELLKLRHLEQMSVEAIALRFHASRTAITTRHLRALQRLRRILASDIVSGLSCPILHP